MVIFKKEMIGKTSVFILYAFIISLIAAIIHFFLRRIPKTRICKAGSMRLFLLS